MINPLMIVLCTFGVGLAVLQIAGSIQRRFFPDGFPRSS
jgi:hypothetical protein